MSFRLQIYDFCCVAVLAKATGVYLGTNRGGRSDLDWGYSITQRVQCEWNCCISWSPFIKVGTNVTLSWDITRIPDSSSSSSRLVAEDSYFRYSTLIPLHSTLHLFDWSRRRLFSAFPATRSTMKVITGRHLIIFSAHLYSISNPCSVEAEEKEDDHDHEPCTLATATNDWRQRCITRYIWNKIDLK